MKNTNQILFLFVACIGLMSCVSRANELTGIYHKEKNKSSAYLKIDGPGLTEKIAVTGETLKKIPDGSRIWIEGEIKTFLTGNPDSDEGLQQQPPQWRVVFVVSKWKAIKKPFEKPKS